MKGYKAVEYKNGRYFGANGFEFEIGKTYTVDGELKMCSNGFHFCKNIVDVFGYKQWNEQTIRVFEIEADDECLQEGTKFCTRKITLIKEVSWDTINGLIDGNYNSGYCNSGRCNSGYCNSGDYNSGGYNSGNCNSGNYNSGNRNSGNRNSGHWNSGDCNSGDYNSGDYNSGNRNSGDRNSGHWNSGFFNSDTPTVRLFNKDSGLTYEKLWSLDIDWGNLENSKDIIKSLPNYDAQIFFEATGIDWRNDDN